MKVLIIEDDFSFAELIKEKVDECGFENAIVHTGADAIEFLNNHTDYVVILDYSLNDMTGKEYISHLQSLDRPTPPFIVATGQGDENIAVDMMKLGARDYLIKNIHFLDILPETLKRMKKELESERMLKQAAEALKESEQKYRQSDQLLRTSQSIAHIGNWQWNLAKNEVSWSDEMYQIFGIEKNSFTGRLGNEIAKIVHPDDIHIFNTSNISHFVENKPVEYRIILKNNLIKHIWAKAGETVFDDDGNPMILSGIAQDITERKKVEQALQKSEEQLRYALEAANDGLWDWDVKNDRIYWSPRAFQMLGYEPNEFTLNFEKWKELVNPDDLEIAFEKVQKTLSQKESSFQIEFRYRTKNDSWIWIIGRGKSVSFEDGKITRIVGTHVDITERKNAEEHLRKFENIVASTDDGIAFLNKNYQYIIVNKGYEKFSGIKADAFIGQTVAEYLGDDVFKDKVKPLFDKCLQGEVVEYQSWFNYQPLGKRFVEVKYFPYRNSQNEIIGVVSNTRDITERKQFEENLRISEQNYKNLFNANTDGISIFTVDEKTQIPQIVEVNKSATEMLGYSIEETIGKDPSYFENNVNSQMLEKRMNNFNANGFAKFETELKHKNGTIVNVLVNAFVVNFNNKMAIMNIIRDITESKKNENSLITSEEKFRKAFMISPDAININTVSDGKYISINPGFTKIMGYTEDDIIGKSSIEANIWNNVEDRKKLVEELKLNGYCQNLEAQFCAKDGSFRYGLMSASLIELEGIKHILSITRDITERKHAEDAVKKSEQQYRNFFEKDLTGDYLSTPEGKIIDCNPAFAKILGYNSVEEALTINTELLYPNPNYRHEFLDILKKNKFLVDYEFSLLRKDGVLRQCIENVSGIFDDSDNLVQFQGYIYDITERKEAEEQLRLNAEQFKVLTETSIDGFWRVDLSAKIIEVNNVFCKMTGYTKEELLKLSISNLDAYENDEDAINHVEKVVQFGYDRFDSKLKCKDGKLVDVEVSTTYSTNLKTVSAFFKDITQKKKAEKDLIQQMEEINRFNKLMIGREEKMIEMKKEINELLVKNGIDPKYKVVE